MGEIEGGHHSMNMRNDKQRIKRVFFAPDDGIGFSPPDGGEIKPYFENGEMALVPWLHCVDAEGDTVWRAPANNVSMIQYEKPGKDGAEVSHYAGMNLAK